MIQKRAPVEEMRKQAMRERHDHAAAGRHRQGPAGQTDFKQVRAVCMK